jgi:hypothetical protein
LTIKLNGLSVKIPNPQLVVSEPYIALDGTIMTNTTVRNLVINSIQDMNKNDMPILGRLFLSSAYLMVNQDAGRFSIWQANTRAGESDIVAFNENSETSHHICGASSSYTGGSKLSAAATAGIVAGAVACIGIMIAIGFFLFYRKRASHGAPTEVAHETHSRTTEMKSPTFHLVPPGPEELPADQYDLIELDSGAVDRRW